MNFKYHLVNYLANKLNLQLLFYSRNNSHSIASSLSDLAIGSPFDLSSAANDNVLTIEELRAHMGSCFTCGVSWTADHVSLDCSECGGYSNQRSCPLCDGKCATVWKRDYSMVSSWPSRESRFKSRIVLVRCLNYTKVILICSPSQFSVCYLFTEWQVFIVGYRSMDICN